MPRLALALVFVIAACGSDAPAGLDVGDCVAFGPVEDISGDVVVDCSQEHDLEVYQVIEYDADAERPTPEEAFGDPEVVDACTSAADETLNLDLIVRTGGYELQPLIPQAQLWDAGLREIYCVVDTVDGRSTGSVLLEG